MWQKREDTIVHEAEPYNAEPSRAALSGAMITPIDTFYSRNHGPVPTIEPDRWRLRVDGLVDRSLEIDLADLKAQFEPRQVVATLQCAGARRAAFLAVRDIPGEAPWGPCATSTARWTGASLGDVLTAAGLQDAAEHLAFEAPDVSHHPTPAQPYGSSITRRKATSPEVLLAWGMNGESLPAVHGGPVRVVVPGWIGARSVKWVERITARPDPSQSYFQQIAYRLLPADADPEGADLDTMPMLSSVALNSDVLVPSPGSTVFAGRVDVSGYAYAGDDRAVVRVDVSLDRGQTWRQAELEQDAGDWAWCRWRTTVEAEPGPLTITVRAWDSTGAAQPDSVAALWNPKGYINNAWSHTTIDVAPR